MIDLIGRAEGTDPVPGNRSDARGYNETLSFGRYTGGPVDLVSMTLDQVDALQTRILRHADNPWNSSAVGRSQFVQKTLRRIRNQLKLSGSALFDPAMQDRLTCFLLGYRGIDKWLAGRMSQDTLIGNLSMEWASFPTLAGTGYYDGQGSRITVADVRRTLDEVETRHRLAAANTSSSVPETPVRAPEPVVDAFGDATLATVMQLAQRPADELDRAAQMIGLARAIQNGWSVNDAPQFIPSAPASNKDMFAMSNTKSIFASKTIIGLIVTAISIWSPAVGQVLSLVGFDSASVDPEAAEQIVSAIEQVVAAAGLLFSAYGRVVAKDNLTVPLVSK